MAADTVPTAEQMERARELAFVLDGRASGDWRYEVVLRALHAEAQRVREETYRDAAAIAGTTPHPLDAPIMQADRVPYDVMADLCAARIVEHARAKGLAIEGFDWTARALSAGGAGPQARPQEAATEQPECDSSHNEYVCSLDAGHAGDHIARVGPEHEVHRWPAHPAAGESDAVRALALIEEWTHQYGAALKPPGADTYGEGMRDAKDQVSRMLATEKP